MASCVRGLTIRWVIANLAGSAVGFGVFAVLAHGLTSPHDEVHPTLAQGAAHVVGLLPAGAIIALSAQFALRGYTNLARWFIPAVIVSMTLAFLVGAYALFPPFDFLFAYAALGAVLELALRSPPPNRPRPAIQRVAATALLFAAGSFLGMLAFSAVGRFFRLRLGQPGEDVARHVVTMVLGGLFIGTAIGLLSVRRLRKALL